MAQSDMAEIRMLPQLTTQAFIEFFAPLAVNVDKIFYFYDSKKFHQLIIVIMKKQTFFASVAGLAALFLVNACQKPAMEEPSIRLSLSEVPVPAEGGDFDVAYRISNPEDGGEVSVELSDPTAAEWVTGLSVNGEESLIDIHVEPSKTLQERSVRVVVSYPGAENAQFTVTQDPGTPDPFTFTLKETSYDSFTFDLIPQDKEMHFFATASPWEYIEAYGLTTDEALYQDDLDYFGDNLGELLVQGDQLDQIYDGLVPNTEYVAYVYGVDPETLERLTDIVYLDVTTDQVELLDVDFDIDVTLEGAKFSFDVDPGAYDGWWTAMCVETASIDPGMSLFDLCSYQWNNTVASYKAYGNTDEAILSTLCMRGPVSGLSFNNIQANTGYTIIIFAVNSEAYACSDVSTASVTTGEGVQGTINFELQFGDYYDIAECAEAFTAAGYEEDGAYMESLVGTDVDCFMPVAAVTTPKVGTFYYTIMQDMPANHVDDATMIAFLQQQGTTRESVYYQLPYDMTFFAVGVAFDDYGNAGPVWESEPFTLTAEGASDPQGFIDYVYPSAAGAALMSAGAGTPRAGTALNSVASFRKLPSSVVEKPAAHRGGEPVFSFLPGAEDLPATTVGPVRR